MWTTSKMPSSCRTLALAVILGAALVTTTAAFAPLPTCKQSIVLCRCMRRNPTSCLLDATWLVSEHFIVPHPDCLALPLDHDASITLMSSQFVHWQWLVCNEVGVPSLRLHRPNASNLQMGKYEVRIERRLIRTWMSKLNAINLLWVHLIFSAVCLLNHNDISPRELKILLEYRTASLKTFPKTTTSLLWPWTRCVVFSRRPRTSILSRSQLSVSLWSPPPGTGTKWVSFMRMPWLVHARDMSHPYAWFFVTTFEEQRALRLPSPTPSPSHPPSFSHPSFFLSPLLSPSIPLSLVVANSSPALSPHITLRCHSAHTVKSCTYVCSIKTHTHSSAMHTHPNTHTQHSPPYSLSLSHPLSHTHTHALSLSLSFKFSLPLSLSPPLPHAHSHIYYTHIHTKTQGRSDSKDSK